MDSTAKYFSDEKDILYRIGETKGLSKGIEEGEKRKAAEIVTNLLLNTDFTIPKIAQLADVSESFVRKIKKTLQ